MLRYDGNDNRFTRYTNGTYDASAVLINDIERRVFMKEQAVKDVKYELDLLKAERLRIYKSEAYYLIANFCPNAFKWCTALKKGEINGEKLDKRKSYDEKTSYNVLVDKLEKYIGHKIEITQHIDYNFGQAWCFEFNSEGHKWRIDIPNVSAVTQRSADDSYNGHCFKLNLYNCDKDHSCVCIGSTFNEEELKDIFEKGLKIYDTSQ